MKYIRVIVTFIALLSIVVVNTFALQENCKSCPDKSCPAKQKAEKVAKVQEKTAKVQKEDEFEEFKETESSDEFQSTDEFSEFKQEETTKKAVVEKKSLFDDAIFVKTLIVLLITIISGFLVRFPIGRNLKGVFIIAMIVWLGFYSGACPCMISSLSFFILSPFTGQFEWVKYLWFLGLIPITYVFGRVWCGWVCHLGGLQEILFIPGKTDFLKSRKAQKILKILQYTSLIALIVQLIITKTYLWAEIDPFKVAFNIYSTTITGYVLLGILLISSIFSYRPFCRGFCPVGLILSWISKIPGASILTIKQECNGCANCDKACKYQAITKDKNILILDNKECIRCGDCMNNCRKEGFIFSFKKSKQDKIAFYNREK